MTFPKGKGFPSNPMKLTGNLETDIALYHSKKHNHVIKFDKYWKFWYCETEYKIYQKLLYEMRNNFYNHHAEQYCLNLSHGHPNEIEHNWDFLLLSVEHRLINSSMYVYLSQFKLDNDTLTYPIER